jgi:hypothetical protein
MQRIIGKFTRILFQEKSIYKQKLKLIRLKALILRLDTIWQDLKENQSVIQNQLKWLITL